jgi:hypothetical protein
MTCVAVVKGPDGGVACGKPAVYVVEFQDGTKAAMCVPCAVSIRQVAISEHKTLVKIERIDGRTPPV